MTKIERQIRMIERTLSNDSDVLKPEQIASLRATLRTLVELNGEEVLVMPGDAIIADGTKPIVLVEPVSVFTPCKNTIPALTPDGVKGGTSTFSFTSPTGGRFTFRVERPKKFRGEYFGALVTGEKSSTYIGMVSENLTLRHTKGSRFAADAREFTLLAIALHVVAGRRTLPDGYELRVVGNDVTKMENAA
jgi:hypothetical protein